MSDGRRAAAGEAGLSLLRPIALVALCSSLVAVGYAVSHLRAGAPADLLPGAMVAGAGYDFFGGAQPGSAGYRISSLAVFSNVALHLKDNYVDPSRIHPKEMIKAALHGIEEDIAEVLVQDVSEDTLRVTVLGQHMDVDIRDVRSLWDINLKLRGVFRFLEKQLPPQDDASSIEYAAANGALSTLDPHSVLLKPDAFEDMKTSTKGEFGGLGIVISIRDNQLTIISPMRGSPATRAGLKAGDVISRIGEVSTVSMPVDEAVGLLRGPEGSKVTVWVKRKSWKQARRFVLRRERIKIQSVEGELLAGDVAYIRVKSFSRDTADQLEAQLERLQRLGKSERLRGLVLDLRGNPGGLMEQAIRIADKFLRSGDIVTTVGYGDRVREAKRAHFSGTRDKLPIAVLLNQGSASASEIVAGALKNLDRAVVIGERSFGKGSVQVLYDFPNKSALKLTIAQYLTPGGVSIQSVGIAPDIQLKPMWVRGDRLRLFHQPKSQREKNLSKHLERAGSATGPTQTSRYKLSYLIDPQQAPHPNADGFAEDFPIRFARQLLQAAGSPSRADTLKRAAAFTDEQRAAAEAQLVAALKAKGVDWSPAPQPAPGPPQLKLRLQKLGDGAPNRVKAGAEVQLKATVENTGTTPIYRLRGELDSEHPSFGGRELVFGRVNPGEKREWTVKAELPSAAAARSDLITLKLSDDSGPLLAKTDMPLLTEQVKHPKLAYSYTIDDHARGDGDGVLEQGEGAELVVWVHNLGEGPTQKLQLHLRSGAGSDLFMERGRDQLDPLQPGQTGAGRLAFKVPTHQRKGGELPLELTIYDAGSGEWLEDELTLKAAPAQPSPAQRLPHSRERGGATLPAPTQLYSSSAKSAAVIGQLKAGPYPTLRARDGRVLVEVQDGLQAWVNRDAVKLHAKPPKAPSTALSFQPLRVAPQIRVDGDLSAQVVHKATVQLKGEVQARELRDLYVLLNGRKVFYKSAPATPPPSAQAPSAQPPKEDAVRMPFETPLALKEGLNKIVIVARIDKNLMRLRRLMITRAPKP